MFQDITIEELLELRQTKNISLIDVRSPEEFADFTIPDSMNIPLFDNEERKEIGTLYKQVSVQAAKERGLEIVSQKLPAFVKQFAQIENQKAVYCWRGGMRSKTTATVLSLMGIRVYRLQEGIRAYRKWVVGMLENFHLNPACISVNGYTGAGKTKILRSLAAKGVPMIDLEFMAQHRGSIFGHIALKSHNQKTFDSLLLDELLKWNDQPFILVEAESKRIGKVVLPEFFVQAKEKGIQLFIDIPVSVRVRNIIEDYQPELNHEACLTAFRRIKEHIHTPVAEKIDDALTHGRYEEGVALLLEYYYDPKYLHSMKQYSTESTVIHAKDTEDAEEQIMQFLDSTMKV